MQKRGYGRVVNLSSGAGQLADMGAGFPAYRMSKAALNALTRVTAAELGPAPIKVNAMCPGWVRTDMGGPNATRPVEQGGGDGGVAGDAARDGPDGRVLPRQGSRSRGDRQRLRCRGLRRRARDCRPSA